MALEILEKLCQTPGIAGREEKIRKLIISEMTGLVDEVKVDRMGNVIGTIKGKLDKSVMIAAHMDEIGFLVKHIDEKGFLRIESIGGFDPRTMVAQRVKVIGRKELKGVLMPGIKPKHLQTSGENKSLKVSDFFVDLGLDKEEVEKLVRVGDFVTMDRAFDKIGNNISSKALDDRAGVYIMLEALKKIKNPEYTVYAVATVQEEVGLRGAISSSYALNPDVGVALDVTIAADIPGTPEQSMITKLGAGAAIKISDSSAISNHKLVTFVRELAEKNNIKHQMEILPRGGTDAGAIERSQAGCPVITISLPTRYVHTVVETANISDLENSIELLGLFLENVHLGDFSF